MISRLFVTALFLASCESTDDDGMPCADLCSIPDAGLTDNGVPPDSELRCDVDLPKVVELVTDDGIVLEADLWSRARLHGPSAILLHMAPAGGNDRTNYPNAFIEQLLDRGLTVLNVDRRGAGTNDLALQQSAATGPNGKLDAKAAYDFLAAHPCELDVTRIGIIGASNGTTTALDFTVFAESDTSTELPKALVFLTGGPYTENQNAISDHRELLDTVPIFFVYAEDEADWSEQFRAGAPAVWSLLAYAPGGHGTRMFEIRPESMDAVSTWIAERL